MNGTEVTPRRGSFVSPGPRALGSTGSSSTPVLTNCPGNDDELERRQRRRSKVTDIRLNSTSSPLGLVSPLPKQAEARLKETLQWSNAQIAEHYNTCIKLSTENKITVKNAFGLHLIDYMTEILKQESGRTDFKVAVGTLDASAKIYSARVDVIHTDTYRVLGGLGSDVAPSKDMENPEEAAGTAPDAAKRAQKKCKRSFKTIAQDLSSIDRPEGSRRGEVDPMFQRAAAAFDQDSTAGVFLSRSHTSGCHSELLFDSKLVPLPAAATLTAPSTEPVAVSGLKALLEKCLEERPICSSLAGFQFTKWDADSHDESVSALLEKFKKSDQVFDVNAEVDSDPEESPPALPHSSFSPGSPRGAARNHLGEFQEDLNTSGTANHINRGDVVSLEEGDIGTMSLHISMKPGEYSYFSPRTLSMWAGPEHWRFKPPHRATAQTVGQRKSKGMKKAFEISFDESIDFKGHFQETKVPVTLARSLLDSDNFKSTTLPTDFNYDPASIVQMFLKPGVKVSRALCAGSSLEPGDGVGEYDYNNPNDTSNFCPALQAADSDEDNDLAHCTGQAEAFDLTAHPEGQGAELSRVNLTTYGELNLIPEPQKVNKLRIQYAKTAKKIDIRRLKVNMWQLLTGNQKKDAAEVKDAEEEEDKSVVEGEKTLSSITEELQCRLPSHMAQELSVPLAFACLLHLANEKNLKLKGKEDLSDVTIKQDT